jgi:hypothetical protein
LLRTEHNFYVKYPFSAHFAASWDSAARGGRTTHLPPDTPLLITAGFYILLLVGLLTLKDKKASLFKDFKGYISSPIEDRKLPSSHHTFRGCQ